MIGFVAVATRLVYYIQYSNIEKHRRLYCLENDGIDNFNCECAEYYPILFNTKCITSAIDSLVMSKLEEKCQIKMYMGECEQTMAFRITDINIDCSKNSYIEVYYTDNSSTAIREKVTSRSCLQYYYIGCVIGTHFQATAIANALLFIS